MFQMVIITLLVHLILPLYGQELLPDGGFEKVMSSICTTPDKAISNAKHWYSLNATPDFFISNCAFDETENFFWKASVTAYEGMNYAGLSGRWNSNATYVSEGIATRLIHPLEEGKTYYFSMAVKNQGGYQGLVDPLTTCSLTPKKHIDIYLSKDSIYLNRNYSNGTATSSGSLVAVLDADVIKSTIIGDWTKVSICFKAKGGEKYFALQMPLGTFGDLPSCAENASSGVFRSFYYYIDDLTLSSVPTIITEKISVCQGKSTEVNLDQLFGSILSTEPTYIWKDGYQGAIRNLSLEGEYEIMVKTGCGDIPISLFLSQEICDPSLFTPNAFTPNGDGVNDLFQIFFPPNIVILKFQLSIFDRWGTEVFRSFKSEHCWDGMANGHPAQTGTYIWVIKLESENVEGNSNYTKSGSVSLIR